MEKVRLTPQQIAENPFSLIGGDWALITASDGERVNTMTASWGCFGILWNKPVFVCFVRPQRFTFEVMAKTDAVSLSFLPDSYRKELLYCGSHSGRDGDKIAATGLCVESEEGCPYIAQAKLVLLGKKIYEDDIRGANFLDPALLQNYPADDFHRFSICEITGVLQAE